MEQYKGKWDVLTVQTDSVNNTLTLWRNGEILANGATSGTLTRARYALGATAANPPVAGFANIALGPHAIFDGILGTDDLRKMREWFYKRYGRLFLGQIVCDGNSLTNGTGGFAYPTMLAATFGAGNNLDVLVRNFGVGGQTTRAMLTDVESQVVARYNSERQYNVCVVWEILNDWAVRVGTDDEEPRDASNNCVDAIWDYCDIVRAAGFKVVVLTVLPATYSVGQNNTERAFINARLRDEWADHADAIADVAADPNIGPNGAQTNATYYSSVDEVHLTEAGYATVSGIVKTAIDTII
jgi:lysophospholipase L1-like esterase